MKNIRVDLDLLKMLEGLYEISDVTVTRPYAKIIQNGKNFNFNDLVEKIGYGEVDTLKKTTHFNVYNININDGELHYEEAAIPVNYFIKNFMFESPGMSWNADTFPGQFYFEAGMGSGVMEGDFVYYLEQSGFSVITRVDKFDLTLVDEYFKDFANYGFVQGTIDANLQVTGNIRDSLNFSTNGKFIINANQGLKKIENE